MVRSMPKGKTWKKLTFTKKQADQMTYISCFFEFGKIRHFPVTRANTELWGLPQYDLKDRIQNLDKESRAFKLFNENTCCICLETFKEVLDDERHLVITSCNNVLCCAWLDNMLKKKKRNETALCPLCKVELEPDIFDLLALYIDLTVIKNLPGVVFVAKLNSSLTFMTCWIYETQLSFNTITGPGIGSW